MMFTTLPPPVRPGDRIGIAALSGPVKPEELELGLRTLRTMGFRPVLANNVRKDVGLFAGSDQDRLDGFHRLAGDSSLKAVLFARGGYGAMRIIPSIDWDLLARNPKTYVGYSDVTPFLLEVNKRLGLASLHGPMLAVDLARGLSKEEEGSFLEALGGYHGKTAVVQQVIGEGVAEGVLSGGCLSLLAANLGTDFAPDFTGKIIFWEEVGEPLYRIDRMLTQLRLAGSLDDIQGMIVGHVNLPDIDDRKSLCQTLANFAHDGGWLVGFGFPAGHGTPNLTIPLGMTAQINSENKTVSVGIPGEGRITRS